MLGQAGDLGVCCVTVQQKSSGLGFSDTSINS